MNIFKKKQRYFFVCYSINTPTGSGFGNWGYKTDGNFPNREELSEEISKDLGIDKKHFALTNFFEFKSEKDFNEFFAK